MRARAHAGAGLSGAAEAVATGGRGRYGATRVAQRGQALTARALDRPDTRRCTLLRATVAWRWRRSCSRQARPSTSQRARCAALSRGRGSQGVCRQRFRAGAVLVSRRRQAGAGRALMARRGARGAGRGAGRGRALTARAPGRTEPRRCTWLRSRVAWRWRRSCSRRARPSTPQTRCAPLSRGRGFAGVFTIVICCQPLFRFLLVFVPVFPEVRREGGFRAASRGMGSRGARRGRGGGAAR